ncbi:MAG: hypothetical protein JWN74_1490 [Acidobacteriaceae bacterium]|nr:hypothetical protein [Acidobacteriaceae bacterium]
MNFSTAARFAIPILLAAGLFATEQSAKTVTVKGYVLDSACAFTKGLKKPISSECAIACAKAGSPLVILAPSGVIYWPIADTTPSSSQNDKLLPFAGKTVVASGKVFERGGSKAIVISKIDAAK